MLKSLSILLSAALLISTSSIAQDFTLSSSDIKEGKDLAIKHVFNGFGCKGENISPSISWSEAPEGAKSFAITMYDPDAPTGSGWWHWTVINIPSNVSSLEKSLPQGAIAVKNDFGQSSYGGACPPPGSVHRYIFTVHALDTSKIDVSLSATNAYVRFLIKKHEIDKASITSIYTR
jgi:hypothetical protein